MSEPQDLTFLFDIPPGISRNRLEKAQTEGRSLDKFEREETSFFDRVRNAYLDRAREDPARFRVIDSTRTLDEVRAELASHLDRLAQEKGA